MVRNLRLALDPHHPAVQRNRPFGDPTNRRRVNEVFFSQDARRQRSFVVARKHLACTRKRTALYEITGNLEGGPIGIRDWGEFPSAGDTSYAGVAPLGGSRFLVTWYSSPLEGDPSWLIGFAGPTDIWKATIDLSRL